MYFIQFFYTNITTLELRLSFKVIAELWDLLVGREEMALLYKWLGNGPHSLTQTVKLDDLRDFFESKMVADKRQLAELTAEGFACYKAVLVALNSQMGLLSVRDCAPPSLYGGYGPSPSPSRSSEAAKCEYRLAVHPLELYGFATLWCIVMTAALPVAQLGQQFLQELCAGNADHQRILEFVFAELGVAEPERVYRLLLVLEDCINQSEVNGPGDLKSLIALRPSEQVHITVLNEHSQGALLPKKISVQLFENQPIIELRHAISK